MDYIPCAAIVLAIYGTGSYSGGVDLAIPMKHTLEYITHEYLNNQSLIDNCVNDVFQSRDGKIWYATDKGVSVYDAQTHLWHHGLYNKVALTICQTVDGRILGWYLWQWCISG